jgi:hypothetical protein
MGKGMQQIAGSMPKDFFIEGKTIFLHQLIIFLYPESENETNFEYF